MLALGQQNDALNQRHIAQTRLRSFLNFEPLGAPEVAINVGNIEAHTHARSEVVAANERRHRAVAKLSDWIGDFVALILQGPGMRELLRNGDMKTGRTLAACGPGIINRAQITSEAR